jgi:sterol desaturase/sphingolipid hydroxylase (fatty acid hydroxylase superfamily)
MYMAIHNRFIHANLKINLGWLGWLLASPQFHRVHHSADPAHRDKNFGRTLSIFDHVFRTAYPSRHVYPETGIADMRYPDEHKVRLRQLPGNWFTQTVYPFAQLFGQ